jgi:MFS family permease
LPLRQRGFRLLWLSSISWYWARWMDILVTSYVTLQITNSAFDVALVGFYRYIPVMLFGAFGGAVADRFDRRLLVMGATVVNSTTMLTVALLFVGGSLQFWHLAAASLVLGLAWAVEWPSRRAMIPDLAGKPLLLHAVVADTISMNANRVLGPLVGGALLATLSSANCYFVLSVLYGLGLFPLSLLRLPVVRQPQRTATLRFIAEGLRYCYRYQVVRGVLLITIVMNAFFFPYSQLLAVVARDVLSVGPVELGVLAAGDGLGSLAGALLLVSFDRLRQQGPVFIVGTIGMSAGLLVFGLSSNYALSLAVLALAGVAHSAFSTYQSTIILGEVGDSLRARVMGVLTVAIGSSPIGILFMGAVAGSYGAGTALAISGALGGLLVLASVAAAPRLLTFSVAGVKPLPTPRPRPAGE